MPVPTAEPVGRVPLVPKKANTNGHAVKTYLLENVSEFRELSEIRQKVRSTRHAILPTLLLFRACEPKVDL